MKFPLTCVMKKYLPPWKRPNGKRIVKSLCRFSPTFCGPQGNTPVSRVKFYIFLMHYAYCEKKQLYVQHFISFGRSCHKWGGFGPQIWNKVWCVNSILIQFGEILILGFKASNWILWWPSIHRDHIKRYVLCNMPKISYIVRY